MTADERTSYDRATILEEIERLAEARLSDPVTLELTSWGDGDFQVIAFHTIRPACPSTADAQREVQGRPFYRERLRFSTITGAGPIHHEVVRRRSGETGVKLVWSERLPSDELLFDDQLHSFYD